MNKPNHTLHEVRTAADERAWLDLPKRLYRDCANWVCPLDTDVQAVFDPARNELFADGEAIRWVVRDAAGLVVGRIAAFYSRHQAAIEEQPTGGCGFFESIDEQAVADLLFDAARSWLADRGMEAMDGPINFGQRRDWWGLLVEGFDYQPLYKNPYHLPYYKALFERYGFGNYFNQHSFIWEVGRDEANTRIFDRAKRLLQDPAYHVEPIDRRRFDRAAEDFRTIYNKAWALFPGVKPMSREEAQELMKAMKPIIDPEIILFAYHGDEPIGFFITIPDLNRIIGRFNGRFGLVQQLRLLWELKVRKSCDRIFGVIFGIAPEYQGKGVESAIMSRYLDFIYSDRNPYKVVELAWIGDFNPVMNRMIEAYAGARRHKVHTTYRYLFDRSKPFKRCPRLGLRRPGKEDAAAPTEQKEN